MRPITDLIFRLPAVVIMVSLYTMVSSQCPANQWDIANAGSAYVDELGNKAIFGNFTNTNESQYVNDGRLYLFGNIQNNGYIGDGFGYEYIKTCDSVTTVISGSGETEFNILDINNTGGIDLKKQMRIKTNLQFSNGVVHAARSIADHEVFFLEGASHLAASNSRHVNGTVRKRGGEPFVFPLGDSDHLAQLKVRGIHASDEFKSAYYSMNLNIFEWLAPGSFHTASTDYNVFEVQDHEFWTLEGSQATEITLYWSAYSDIQSLTQNVNDLVVVGWRNGRWENLGQTNLVQVFTTGTLTSRAVVPDSYEAFTFGIADTDGDGIPDSEDEDPFDPCLPDPMAEGCINRICVDLTASVYMEGPMMFGGIGNYSEEMRSSLNTFGYLPGQAPSTLLGVATQPGQPYEALPWLYYGAEGSDINEINPTQNPETYPENAVDWVLVSLRSSTEPTSTVCTKAALVLSDGQIQLTEFFDCCNLIDTSYFVVIEHRNHLPVMSHIPIPVTDQSIHYDFRNQQSYTQLLGYGQKEVLPGIYAMYAGNGDQVLAPESPVDINTNDITLWALDNGKHSGYYLQDYDLSGDVNVHDKGLWLLNNGVFTDVDR